MFSRISTILIVSIMNIRWRLAALTPSSRLIILISAFWLLCALGTLPLASAQKGTLEWGEITSPALAGNLIGDPDTRSFAIYLPPSYNTSDKHYPVFYELGAGGGEIGPEVARLQNTIDLMIQNRDIGEMIVVFPVYEELGSGHGTPEYYPEKLQFFSEHLLEEGLAVVDARGKLGVTWGEIKQGQ